ncbi:hypothetical protein BD410DRAFT_830303 [Rickenella mellea]|uniref:F-box domain-containing protein n=1 Tax=Rickenella mellea TaxID=50990 RepID=A0A4Y7PWU8_9AGAM|nr:hypothetical protein BD410DRAFT_830303 [Rickenella mellea]
MLPCEVIEEIMRIVIHDQFTSHSLCRFRRTAYAWFSQVLHVCRYLRHVSLRCPALWSYIDTSWNHLVETLIQMSLSASLTVIVQFNEQPTMQDNNAIHLVLGEMHRVKNVQFHGEALALDFLRFTLPSSTPNLETLVLTSTILSGFPNTLIKCLQNISDEEEGDLRLRKLFIFNVAVPTDINPCMLRGLRYLKISAFFDWGHTGPSYIPNASNVCQIIEILSQCQNLVEFEFNDYHNLHPSGESDPDDFAALVALPRLQRLHLTLHANSCISLLRHISLPPGVSLYMSGEYNIGPNSTIPPECLAGYKCINVHTSDGLTITADIPNQQTLEIHIPSRRWEELSWEDLCKIVSCILGPSLREVETLILDDYSSIFSQNLGSKEALKPLLASLSHIERLQMSFVTRSTVENLVDALSDTTSTDVTCPKLRIFELHNKTPTRSVTSDFKASTWAKVISCISWRRELGACLERLDISDCGHAIPDAEQICILSSLVGDLRLS